MLCVPYEGEAFSMYSVLCLRNENMNERRYVSLTRLLPYVTFKCTFQTILWLRLQRL